MSSSPQREPLTGTICQGKRVIGGVCLPEHDIQGFVEHFNHCYGPIGLKIELPKHLNVITKPQKLLPVGAGHYDPFRKLSP